MPVPSVGHSLALVQEAREEDKQVDSQNKEVVVVEDSRLQLQVLLQAEEDGAQWLVGLKDCAQYACMVEH